MIKKFLENINTRKVLIEKYPELLEEHLLGMEFSFPRSKHKSELKVQFKRFSDSIFPNVKGDVLTDLEGQLVVSFDPFDIEICSSIDNNSSADFIQWVEMFLSGKPYGSGTEVTFFNYSHSKKTKIICLRGCVLDAVDIKGVYPTITIKFFAYHIPENS